MVNRIDLFMPPAGQHGVLSYLTKEINDALGRQGVATRLLVSERENPDPFLEAIFKDPPDCTLSLNGLLPDENGNFFCNMIKIPHVACLMDSFTEFSALAGNPLNIITCPDAFACHYFSGLGCDRSLFMPQGVNPAITADPQAIKKYDSLFIGSCIDYEYIRAEWKNKYPEQICEALENAQKIALSDHSTSYIEALVQALNETSQSKPLDMSAFNMLEMIQELELFIKGKDRVELIRAIKTGSVTIFGSTIGQKGWEAYLKDQPNVKIHSPIPFESAIEAMKMSKIVLNSSPASKNGTHERVMAALGSESFVLTNHNVFHDHHFINGQDMAFYNHGEWSDADEIVAFYLENDAEREAAAKSGREKAMLDHTWDRRIQELLEKLPPLLEKARSHIQ
jgi:spore maturation protein CgeB